MAEMAVRALPVTTPGVRTRLQSIDILRGAIMIIMALDHTRDFFSTDAQHFAPDDLSRTTAALFLTRWITHFCAPGFMFLAGTGAFLWQQRGRTRADLSRFLLTRGLWLILLELTVVRLGFFFNLDYSSVMLIVFWALGAAMIALALLVHLPPKALLAVSIAMIALHNLFDGIKAAQFGGFAGLWNVLHQQGAFRVAGHVVVVAYPLVPWIGVMSAGYCFGQLFLLEPDRRRWILLRLGSTIIAAFLVMRAVNVYGDPRPWTAQKSALFTVFSFLNCAKYPPSLDFLLMTLGPLIVVLGLIEYVRLSSTNPLVVFGRVPLFYFVWHIWLIHAVAVLMAGIHYGDPAFLLKHQLPTLGGRSPGFPADYGYNLAGCYFFWALIVFTMYFPCRWFAGLKARRREAWLSYL